MRRIIECVPNFSEGRDVAKINAIVESIRPVKVLHVDIGQAANRTVITFAGSPEDVVDAAFRAVKTAGEVIDMSCHKGEHPRIGATDVMPLIPISGVTLEECADMSDQLARRIADELEIPCYLYEASAKREKFQNLALCRRGGYEALPNRLTNPEESPDYGSRPIDDRIRKTGCTVVGARNYLVAINFNINTKDVNIASEIAGDVRESGRKGQPGILKKTKAIGWYIEEYGCAQVSMNLTDISVTPISKAFFTVRDVAKQWGVEVTGTELIGMIPASAYEEALPIIDELNLSEVKPFNPDEKIIERVLFKNR